jgi:hypothetical protein
MRLLFRTTDTTWVCPPSICFNSTYCHVYLWLQMGFGLVIGFIENVQVVVTANKYNTVVDFHITNYFTLDLFSLLSLVPLTSLNNDYSFTIFPLSASSQRILTQELYLLFCTPAAVILRIRHLYRRGTDTQKTPTCITSSIVWRHHARVRCSCSIATVHVRATENTKFKPLIFSVIGFALSSVANIFVIMILCDFCWSPA